MKKTLLLIGVLVATCALAAFGAGQSGSPSSGTSVGDSDGMMGNMYTSGLPIVKDKVTYKIAAVKHDWATKNYEDMQFFKTYEDETNVHIEWELSGTEGWNERQTLMFASGDLPDAFYGNGVMRVNTGEYGMAGQLMAIEELIDRWAPLYSAKLAEKPILRQVSTELDGHIYALRSIYQARRQRVNEGIHINQEWLDDLGLKIPETTEEFYQTLKAFKGHKENAIPFTFRWGAAGINDMFGSWGFFMSNDFIDVTDDNKLVWVATLPEFREAIRYFNRLFAEDLVDPEVFTHSVKVYRGAKYASNPNYGAFTSYLDVLFLGNWDENLENEYTRIPPLAGPDGTRMWHEYQALGGPGFAITPETKNPEILIRWIDQSVDPNKGWEANAGLWGQVIEKLPNGKIHQLDPPEGYERNTIRHLDSPGINGFYVLLEDEVENTEWTPLQLSKTAMVDVYEPYFRKAQYVPAALKFTQEEIDTLALMRVDLTQFTKTTVVKWMTEGGIDAEWDDFRSRLAKMGLEEYMEIYNRAQARFVASSK